MFLKYYILPNFIIIKDKSYENFNKYVDVYYKFMSIDIIIPFLVNYFIINEKENKERKLIT